MSQTPQTPSMNEENVSSMQSRPPGAGEASAETAVLAAVEALMKKQQSNSLTAKEALATFEKDPLGFVQGVVEAASKQHLALMQEQAELTSALQFYRSKVKDFRRFEPYILQEVAQLIQQDADGVLDPWPDLLEKGLSQFQERFMSLVQKQPERREGEEPTFVEHSGQRKLPKGQPKFSRKQIEKMSLDEFLAHEDAINQAMKQQRIQ